MLSGSMDDVVVQARSSGKAAVADGVIPVWPWC